MRVLAMIGIGFCMALGACDDPEVRACEVFLKKTLRDPTSYKRISITKADQHFANWKAYQERTGDERPLSIAKSFGVAPAGRPGLRTVAVSYEAANGVGDPVPGRQICAFELRNGELGKNAEDLERAAIVSYSHVALRGLLKDGSSARAPETGLKFDCCM
jgi:hypothetical protein